MMVTFGFTFDEQASQHPTQRRGGRREILEGDKSPGTVGERARRLIGTSKSPGTAYTSTHAAFLCVLSVLCAFALRFAWYVQAAARAGIRSAIMRAYATAARMLT